MRTKAIETDHEASDRSNVDKVYYSTLNQILAAGARGHVPGSAFFRTRDNRRTKLLERISGAKAAVHQLRPLGVFAHVLSQVKAIRLYKALIQPRWEYAMHISPGTDEASLPVQEVEKAVFRQAFGPIAHGRVNRLKLLSRIRPEKATHRQNAYTYEKRKKIILSEPPGPNYHAELYWLEQDAKEMLLLDTIEEASKIMEEKTSPKALREIFITRAGEKLETGRKRRIRFDAPGKMAGEGVGLPLE